jgi:UDP-N-acetyl-D-mannosaminuronate dehydrogenase
MSYKANVGDLRESPAIDIKEILIENEAVIEIFDPYFPELSTCSSLEELMSKSFAILLATDHDEFRGINQEMLIKNDIKIVIDGKNCLNKEEIQKAGIYYKGIGR